MQDRSCERHGGRGSQGLEGGSADEGAHLQAKDVDQQAGEYQPHSPVHPISDIGVNLSMTVTGGRCKKHRLDGAVCRMKLSTLLADLSQVDYMFYADE